VSKQLFNSTSAPVPPLRRDVQVIPVRDNGRDLLIFHDPRSISPPGFALDGSVQPLLSLIDGHKSLSQISAYFKPGVSATKLLEFVQILDRQKLLESPYFIYLANNIEEEFERSNLRQPALAGSSYPEDPDELKHFMDQTMDHAGENISGDANLKALYAPHIDLKVGSKQYAEAFSTIKHLTPERVVILATSHYSGYYPEIYDGHPFIGSRKHFRLPGRTLQADQISLDFLETDPESTGFTLNDRAHRIEHSIETHLLFASYIWDHDFKIVPILIGGLDDLFYKPDGDLGRKIEAFTSRLRQLDSDKTFFLISGDLSHVGKKFGDSIPAEEMRSDVESFDTAFIETALNGDEFAMLSKISKQYDSYRVCGFPPLFSFLNTFPNLPGRKLNYHWWDETERESAVSFGSILY